MKLSIIIPVYNEENTVGEVIRRVSNIKIPGVPKEIIVVDDGSTDASASEIRKLNLEIRELKFFTHEKNQGKGAAVTTGIENATGDYIIIQDADLEYNPKDIPRLMEPVIQAKAQIVFGTRLKRLPNLRRDERTLRFLIHYFGNRFLSLLTSILYGQWITDMETGYKLFPKNALGRINLRARRFDFEPEITAKLLKNDYKIMEVSIITMPRDYKEGKKLNTFRDGIIALWSLFKFRISD